MFINERKVAPLTSRTNIEAFIAAQHLGVDEVVELYEQVVFRDVAFSPDELVTDLDQLSATELLATAMATYFRDEQNIIGAMISSLKDNALRTGKRIETEGIPQLSDLAQHIDPDAFIEIVREVTPGVNLIGLDRWERKEWFNLLHSVYKSRLGGQKLRGLHDAMVNQFPEQAQKITHIIGSVFPDLGLSVVVVENEGGDKKENELITALQIVLAVKEMNRPTRPADEPVSELAIDERRIPLLDFKYEGKIDVTSCSIGAIIQAQDLLRGIGFEAFHSVTPGQTNDSATKRLFFYETRTRWEETLAVLAEELTTRIRQEALEFGMSVTFSESRYPELVLDRVRSQVRDLGYTFTLEPVASRQGSNKEVRVVLKPTVDEAERQRRRLVNLLIDEVVTAQPDDKGAVIVSAEFKVYSPEITALAVKALESKGYELFYRGAIGSFGSDIGEHLYFRVPGGVLHEEDEEGNEVVREVADVAAAPEVSVSQDDVLEEIRSGQLLMEIKNMVLGQDFKGAQTKISRLLTAGGYANFESAYMQYLQQLQANLETAAESVGGDIYSMANQLDEGLSDIVFE